MAEQGPQFGFGFDGDEQSARTEAERMAEVIEKGLTNAFAKIGPVLARELQKGFARGNKTKGLLSEMQEESAKFTAAAAKHSQRLREDFVALEGRIDAVRATLNRVGADPRLFDVINRELAVAMSNLRDFDRELEEGLNDPVRLDGLERSLDQIQKTIFRELGQNQSLLRNLSKERQEELSRESRALDRAAQQRLLDQRQTFSREFQLQQGADARRLAETRIAGQRQIQAERQTQRTRIELLRFALNQIRTIEKGIGSIFSGTARALTAGLGGVAAVANRLSGIFRRSNRDMNDGLRGALIQREGAISRSFRSQSTIINRELREQSIAIERFERQANTGVIGALSGRSRLGSALGLGAGIGGGFALFQGLRNGFNVGGDFVQGLAVLGAQLELTEAQMQAVREQAIQLGNDISLPGVSALDAAQAIQLLAKQFASLGAGALPAAQAAAKGVLQLSRAAGVQAEEAARVVGAAVNVFGVEASKAVDIADQITNAMTNAAGVGFNDFADAFTQSASVVSLFTGPAAQATETVAEFNAAIAVLAKGGLIGSDAGTSLKQFFLQANRGTEDATDAMSDLTARAGETGSAFFDASGQARKLSDTIDILRRGVRDLSDQQRTQVFQKLFGSDAARAAAILVDLGGNFDQLVTRIERQGAAAEIAAAQNVGLRGALDALGSVIETQQIKTYERYQGVLARVVLKFAELLQAFFDGRGVFEAVRTALTGVAVALGGLLAVKAVAEGFQFLGLAVRSTLTPLGAFLTVAASVGAAFAVLRKVSPEFRDETDAIGRSLAGGVRSGLKTLADLLADVSRFLRVDVLPRFVAFGVVVASSIVPAFQTLVRFIGDRVVPVLRQAATILTDDIIPAAGRFGGALVNDVLPPLRTFAGSAVDAVSGFLSLIDPAISGFQRLGGAIRVAFNTRDASGLTSALAGARDGLLASFRNIGDALVELLRPQLDRLLDFIAAQLSPRNLDRAVQGVAALVFKIGETLGSIVSDPRFVAALEGIVVAFTAVAGLALAGFAKGIIDNIPALGKGLLRQFQFVLNSVFEDGINYKKLGGFIVLGLASAITAGALFSGFRSAFKAPTERAGREAAKGFGRSFTAGLRAVTFRGNEFAAGFFGGSGEIERVMRRQGERAARALNDEFNRINRNLQRLGADTVAATGPQGRTTLGTFASRLVTDEDVQLARKRFAEIETAAGSVTTSGALLRGQLSDTARSLGGVFKGLGASWSGDISTGNTLVRTSLGRLRTNVGDTFANLRSNFSAAGIGLGQALGGAIVSGVGAALAGQQLGSANSTGGRALGLAGVIASALFAATAVGGGPQGAIVGGAVGILGLLTAAFADNGDAAEEARQRVQAYLDIFKQFDTVSGAIPTLAERLADVLLVEGSDVDAILSRSGFNIRDFIRDAVGGQGSLGGALRDITSGLGIDQRRVEAFLSTVTSTADALDDLNDAARGRTTTNQAQALIADFQAAGFDAEALITILEVLNKEGGAALDAKGKSGLRDQLLSTSAAAAQATAAIQAGVESFAAFGRPLQGSTTNGQSVFFQNLANNVRINADIAKRNIDAVTQATQSLNEQRTQAIQDQIGALTTKLTEARDRAKQALDNITSILTGQTGTPLVQAFDSFVAALPGASDALSEAINRGLDFDAARLGALTPDATTARNAALPLLGPLTEVVSAAILDGTADTRDEMTRFFESTIRPAIQNVRVEQQVTDPVTGEVSVEKVALPQNVQDFLFAELQRFLADKGLTGNLDELAINNAVAADTQRRLDDLNAELPVKVTFSPYQVAAELRRLQDLGLFSGLIPTNQQIAQAQAAAAAAAQPNATSPATADAAERAAASFNVENINIYETTTARASASAVTRELREFASAGFSRSGPS